MAAVKQEWRRRPVLQRDDIPAWVRESPLFYTISVRGNTPDGQSGYRGPLLAENILEWSNKLKTPVSPLLMACEKHGIWITPDYFPPVGGDDSFRRMTTQLAAEGRRSMVYLSGLYWTLVKTRAGVSGHDAGAPLLSTT
ncbi:MAG: hypothetical protein IT165_03665 [Bryobacterales bacterium]|nr:hypothetical protein [Bryobacterales bacterium]